MPLATGGWRGAAREDEEAERLRAVAFFSCRRVYRGILSRRRDAGQETTPTTMISTLTTSAASHATVTRSLESRDFPVEPRRQVFLKRGAALGGVCIVFSEG